MEDIQKTLFSLLKREYIPMNHNGINKNPDGRNKIIIFSGIQQKMYVETGSLKI